MEQVRRLTRRVTAICLVASTVVLVPGIAGLGASVLLTVTLAGCGLLCVSARERLQNLPAVAGYRFSRYAQDLWLAFFLAAALLVAFSNAEAGELQTLGGAAGVLGMLNHFLTPLYLFIYAQLLRFGDGQRQTSDGQV